MKYQVLFSHDEPHGTIDAGIIAEGSGNDGGLAAGAEGIGLEMLPQGVEEDITGTGDTAAHHKHLGVGGGGNRGQRHAQDVFDAARAGDALAAREVDEMASTLGMALANIAATTDPEMFMIGGGVARAGEVLFNPLVRHYKEYAFQSCKETPIKAASLGNDAGFYGAVRLIVGA